MFTFYTFRKHFFLWYSPALQHTLKDYLLCVYVSFILSAFQLLPMVFLSVFRWSLILSLFGDCGLIVRNTIFRYSKSILHAPRWPKHLQTSDKRIIIRTIQAIQKVEKKPIQNSNFQEQFSTTIRSNVKWREKYGVFWSLLGSYSW